MHKVFLTAENKREQSLRREDLQDKKEGPKFSPFSIHKKASPVRKGFFIRRFLKYRY